MAALPQRWEHKRRQAGTCYAEESACGPGGFFDDINSMLGCALFGCAGHAGAGADACDAIEDEEAILAKSPAPGSPPRDAAAAASPEVKEARRKAAMREALEAEASELRRAVADAIACEAGWDLGDGPQD